MSADKEGLVESSSNLGLFSLSEDGVTFTAYESVEADTPERRAITDWCVPAQLIYPGLLRELEKTAP